MASNTPPSGPDPAPHASPGAGVRKRFGKLIYTTHKNINALGKRIRLQVSGVKTTSAHVVHSTGGTFNLMVLLELDGTKMTIHLPACGRSGSLTEPADAWLRSHVQTLKYVRSHTNIPVPEVYASDTTANNEISAPYIAMSYIEGRTVADLWFDDRGPTALETRRRRILEHLAQLMPQLHVQRFDEIGSLVPLHPSAPADDRVSPKLGPCFGWDYADDGLLTIDSSAPFKSNKAWLANYWAPLTQIQGKSDLRDGCYKLLKTVLSLIPPPQTSDFALAPYNFDWQNVLADEDGTITALINWDCAQTTPDILGCLRYPPWIVHDRDPTNGNSNLGGRDSAKERQEYRAYYLGHIKIALAQQGSADDCKYTANSDAAEAFWVAYTNPKAQVGYCQEFVEVAKDWIGSDALTPGLRQTPLRILEDIGRDKLQHADKATLAKSLKAMMSY